MEKNTIGNEPYIEKATVLGSFFVLIEDIKIVPVNKNINWSYFYYLTDKNVSRSALRLRTQSSRSARPFLTGAQVEMLIRELQKKHV